MGIFSTMMWNAIHMATHGLTTVNKRVETLKIMQTACERSRNESNLSITAPGYYPSTVKR